MDGSTRTNIREEAEGSTPVGAGPAGDALLEARRLNAIGKGLKAGEAAVETATAAVARVEAVRLGSKKLRRNLTPPWLR